MSGNESAPSPCGQGSSGSVDWYWWYSWWVNGVLGTAVSVAGAAGNVYATGLLRRRSRLRKSIWVTLVALAGWDAALLLSSLFYFSLGELSLAAGPKWQGFTWLTLLTHPLASLTMTGSIWQLLLVSAERHWAISAPLYHRSIDTPSRSLRLCYLVLGAALLFNLPSVLELRPEYCLSEGGGTEVVAAGSWLRRHRTYVAVYRVGAYLVLISLVPFAGILVVTLRILVVLRSVGVERRKSLAVSSPAGRRSSRLERSVTWMLVALAGKFLLCHSLPTLLNVWERMSSESTDTLAFLVVTDLSNLLVLLNSATNAFVYLGWRSNFRRKPKSFSSNGSFRDSSSVSRQTWRQTSQSSVRLDRYRESTRRLLTLPPPSVASQAFSASEVGLLSRSWEGLCQECPELPVCLVPSGGASHGALVDAELRSLIGCLTSPEAEAEGRERLRELGQRHAGLCRVRNGDWAALKETLLTALPRLTDDSTDFHLEELRRLWSTLLSLLISEMKKGATIAACERAHMATLR